MYPLYGLYCDTRRGTKSSRFEVILIQAFVMDYYYSVHKTALIVVLSKWIDTPFANLKRCIFSLPLTLASMTRSLFCTT